MKKALIVLLVVVMVVIGLPLPIMGAMGCTECPFMAAPAATCFLAVVFTAAATVLWLLLVGRRLSVLLAALTHLVERAVLFRPPRFA